MTEVSKRVYIGGLYPGVTEAELKDTFSKFGIIERVDIKQKKQVTGFPEKTFAYINFSTTEEQLKRCFSIFNKSKWKGHELKLQVAKENFIERLNEERRNNFEESDTKPKKTGISKPLEDISGVKDFMMSGAVPGTSVTEEKTWIVGKYGRVLPVVHMHSRDKRKMMKVDPSKYCHFVKKFKENSMTEKSDDDLKTITWNIEEEESEILRKRKGEFPKWQSKPKKKKSSLPEIPKNLSKTTIASKQSHDTDFEIVSSKLDLTSVSRVYFSEESDDDTDYTSMRNKLPKHINNNMDSKNVESLQLTSLNVSPKLVENIGHTEKLRFPSVKMKCLGKKDQNETSQESSQSSEESSIFWKFESEHNTTAMSTSDTVPSLCKSSGHPKQQSSVAESVTKPTLSKPKLQPFRGINQLFDGFNESCNNSSTEVGTLVSGCHSEVDMEATDCHSNKSLSSNDSNVSDSDDKSVSSADTDTVIAATKKDKTFCSPNTTTAASMFTSDHHSNKTLLSCDRNVSDSDDDSVSSADTETIIAATKKDKTFCSPNTTTAASMFTSDHHSNKTLLSCDRNVSDSDDDSVSSADTETIIAAAKKDKIFCSPSTGIATPMNKKSMLDEFSSGLLEEEVKGQGSYSTSDDSDIEDNFEKLVKNGLSKWSDNQSVSDKRFDELESETEIEVVFTNIKPSVVHKALPESESKGLSLSSGGKRTSLVSADEGKDNSHPSSAEDKIDKESKGYKDVASNIDKKSLKLETNKKREEKLSNSQDSIRFIVDNEKQKQKEIVSVEHKHQQSLNSLQTMTSAKSSVDKKLKINQKRLESLEERKKVHTEQKSLIKQALASIDKPTLLNKKIVFDSDEEVDKDIEKPNVADKIIDDSDDDEKVIDDSDDDNSDDDDDNDDDDDDDDEDGDDDKAASSDDNDVKEDLETKKEKKNKDVMSLFESSSDDDCDGHLADDEDDDTEAFRVRPQFEGDKGQKLMELQMRFGNDERFRLDERFVEEEDSPSPEVKKDLDADTMDEKSRALRVLQEVVGNKVRMPVDNKEKSKRLFRDMSALQYDPDTEHHKELEIDMPATKPQIKKKSKTKVKPEEVKTEEIEIPEVSKDRYYEVSETLTDIFKKKETTSPQASSFSLLAAFGTQNEDNDLQEDEEQGTVDHGGVLSWQRHALLDSSEDSASEEEKCISTVEVDDSKVDVITFSNKVQTFFFTDADSRIAEGIANFCRHGDLEDIREKWQEKRPSLIESYRKKHKKILRNARTMDKKKMHYRNMLQRKEMLKN